MAGGCQTCLRVMKDPFSEGLYLNSVSSGSDTITLEEKLADCVPELILDSVQNAVLCHSCVEKLTLAYQFKQRCLDAQQKIYGFLQQVPDNTQTDIGKIAAYYQRLEIIEQGGDPSVDDPPNINVNHAEMPYSCKWCPFSCLDKCVMRQHRILHRNKAPPYKCDQCYFIFPTAVLLLDHLASHSNEQPYACTLCDFESSSHKKLKKHGWVHRKAFQCNICWERFAQRNELDVHVEAHNCELRTRRFRCGLCKFKCDALHTINSHSVNSHQNTYNCKTCRVKCRTQLGLMQHRTQVHKEPAEAPQEMDVYEDINCHSNDDVIIVPDDDNENKRTISGSEQSVDTSERFFVCANCSLDCKSLDNFKTHFENCDLQYYQNQEFCKNLQTIIEVITDTNVQAQTSVDMETGRALGIPPHTEGVSHIKLTRKQKKNRRRVGIATESGSIIRMKRKVAVSMGLWHPQPGTIHPTDASNQEYSLPFRPNMSVQQITSNVEQEALDSNVLPLTIVSENNDVNTEVTNVAKNMDIKTTNLLPNIKANQNLDLNVQNTSEIPQNTERKGSDGISKRFPCEHCPIICISQRTMNNHLRRAHRDVMADLRTPSHGDIAQEKGETLDSDAVQKTNIDENARMNIVPHYSDYDVDEHQKLNIAEKKLDSNVENNVDLSKPPGTNTSNQTSHPVGLVSNNQSITVPQSVAAQSFIDVKNGYQCAWCSAKPKTYGNLCLHVNTEHGKCIQQWKSWLSSKIFKQSEDNKNEPKRTHKCKLCPTECGSQNAKRKPL